MNAINAGRGLGGVQRKKAVMEGGSQKTERKRPQGKFRVCVNSNKIEKRRRWTAERITPKPQRPIGGRKKKKKKIHSVAK